MALSDPLMLKSRSSYKVFDLMKDQPITTPYDLYYRVMTIIETQPPLIGNLMSWVT